MGGRIISLVWVYLAVPGANPTLDTKDDEIEKQENTDTVQEITSPHCTVDCKTSDTNTDWDPDTEKGVAVKRAFASENVAETTSKASLPLHQDTTNVKKIYTQTFGFPGPPYSYPMNNTIEIENDTCEPMASKSDLQLESTDPSVIQGVSKSLKSMQNVSIQYQNQVPSLSTLTQDDITMDAVMGRPPRLTEAGRRLQREQEERERARQQKERELNADKIQLQMEKDDHLLLSAPAPREKPEETFHFSKPTHERITEIQRSILMDTKAKLEKNTVKVNAERDAEMVKFIKDLAKSVPQPPPFVKYFDAAVVYDRHDYEEVKDFIDELKLMTATEVKQELRIELFDSEEFAQSMIMSISDVVERCSVVFVYLTENSNTDLIRLFCDEAVGLSRLGLNDPAGAPGRHAQGRQWMLKPVHTQPLKKRKYPTPVGLLTLTGLDWYDWPSLFVRDRAKSILSSAISNRKARETKQNISNKYDSTFGSIPTEFESNESLKAKLGIRDPAFSIDALSVHAAHLLKPAHRASTQNAQHNKQLLFPENSPGNLSSMVSPQQRYQSVDRHSVSQQSLSEHRQSDQQLQHQIPTGYRPMLNVDGPPVNNTNIQGRPRMQLFTPNGLNQRPENPTHNSEPQMHHVLSTLHPSSLYQDQLSYQYPYNGQNTNLGYRPQDPVVSGQHWTNREFATRPSKFQQNSQRNQEWFQLQTGSTRVQSTLGGSNQNMFTDEFRRETNRPVEQQLNTLERNLSRDQDWNQQQTWLTGAQNMSGGDNQNRFTSVNDLVTNRVDEQQRYRFERNLSRDENWCQLHTGLTGGPNITNVLQQDRFTRAQNVPRAYHQNRHTGEYGLQGAGGFNSAEYGSLMMDPRHDTPLSSELTVVSRLTGKLITNPDLSNGDLEIDGDRNPDTLSLVNGNIDSLEADDPSDSSAEDDDDDADSEDSDYGDSLRDIFPRKEKILNIIGSKVVQLGRDNQSFEQYITKQKRQQKGNHSTCTNVKNKDKDELSESLSRVKEGSPTIQNNIKRNARATDDDSEDKGFSPTKPVKSDRRTEAIGHDSRDKGDSSTTTLKSDRRTEAIAQDSRDEEDSSTTPLKSDRRTKAADDDSLDKGYSPTNVTKSDRRTRGTDDDSGDEGHSSKKPFKSDDRTRASEAKDTILIHRDAQKFAEDSVDMRPSYLDERIDAKRPYSEHSYNTGVSHQPKASKLSYSVNQAGEAIDLRATDQKMYHSVLRDKRVNDLDRCESLEENSSYSDGNGQSTCRKMFPDRHDKLTPDSPATFAFTTFRTSIITKLTSVPYREAFGGEICAFETDLD